MNPLTSRTNNESNYNTDSNYQDFAKFKKSADKIKASDGTTVYNFKSQAEAEKFSECLKNIGIVGASGNKKYVAKHLSNNNDYGVVLIKDNIAKLKQLKIINEVKAKVLEPNLNKTFKVASNDMPKLVDEADQLSKEITQVVGKRFLGYYRNSTPSAINMALALATFAKTNGDFTAHIEAANASGHGSSDQPDTVADTFRLVIVQKLGGGYVHGGVRETVEAMKSGGEDLDVAAVLEKAIVFIERIKYGS